MKETYANISLENINELHTSIVSTKLTQHRLNTYLNTFQPKNGIFSNTVNFSPQKRCVYKKKVCR